jgi:putative aminopeptidase FrvX
MDYINVIKDLCLKVFNIDSPTGYSNKIDEFLLNYIKDLGYDDVKITNKGNVRLFIKGKSNKKSVATSAHSDTLGLMVRSIDSDGTLNVTQVGGPQLPTLDGEYCKIITRDEKIYSGTILCKSSSSHVYDDAKNRIRDIDSLMVRLDEDVFTKEDVLKLGITNGAYVAYDTKTVITENGFLKSRFIDDKASVVAILTMLKKMKDLNEIPSFDTYVYFVNQEEVGHGASTVDKNISEFVTVDMGCVGKDLDGSEYKVSICAKDSGGPYSYNLTNKLINIAKDNNIDYVIDIFPFYGSDIGAAWRSGTDCEGALIGQGVSASHGMERTTLKGIMETMNLLYLYLTK